MYRFSAAVNPLRNALSSSLLQMEPWQRLKITLC